MLLSLGSGVGGGVLVGIPVALFITVVIILSPGNHAELNNTPESDMKAGGSWAVLSRSVSWIFKFTKKVSQLQASFFLSVSMTSFGEGLLFALVFGIGSIFGMMIAGMVISFPVLVAQRYGKLSKALMVVAGCVSTIIGFIVIKENWPFN